MVHSNFTQGRIAAAHGRIRQVAPMCTCIYSTPQSASHRNGAALCCVALNISTVKHVLACLASNINRTETIYDKLQ